MLPCDMTSDMLVAKEEQKPCFPKKIGKVSRFVGYSLNIKEVIYDWNQRVQDFQSVELARVLVTL